MSPGQLGGTHLDWPWVSYKILGLVSASVVNTGDYKPMDRAPMPHGGGSTDDQCAHGKRERNGVTQRCPTSSAGAFAAREGRGRRAIQISRDKRGSGIILHGGNGTNHLRVRPYPALSVVSMRYTLTNHTLDHAPSIRVWRFHQKRTCPDHDPCSLPIDHRSF
jgi:hypothetical protein